MNTQKAQENDKSRPAKERKPPRFLIGVRVLNETTSELYDPNYLDLRVGMDVVIDAGRSTRIGTIASNKILNFGKNRSQNFRKVLRIANEQDLQALERKKSTERKAREICLDKILQLKLPMNLSRVLHAPEANKTIFFFTAEGRVDFRQLIKELAAQLRHRIEMKQVGVRDEARSIAGYGICGESLCCATFLTDFNPVTIRMAKDQGLALNPSKISGVCGRLMCCLQYEHDNYRKLIKTLPKMGAKIETPEGPGKVINMEILEQKIVVRLNDESIFTYHLSELAEFLPPNKNVEQPKKP
jgi:cell fate regulator YaaT (PSP1 superfamily)